MRSLLLTLLLSTSCWASCQSAAENFSGSWQTDKGAVIIIAHSADRFSAILQSLQKEILQEVHFADGEWHGLLIRPKDGSKHHCTLRLKGDELQITVRKGLLNKTLTLNKL